MRRISCIIATGVWGGHRCLLKNRDRNYTPELRVVHEIRNGVEILYVEDEGTGWAEGLNEHGIGVVNSALMVGRDEAEKKIVKEVGKKSKDGERIIEALTHKKLDDAVASAATYKGGIKGHTFLSDGKRTVAIEATSKHEVHQRELSPGRLHVRTNHGFEYEDAGYTEGDDYVSSIARREKAIDILDDLTDPDSLAPALMDARKQDRHHPNNMVRDTDNMSTTSIMVIDLKTKTLRLHLIDGKVEFLGYSNKLPKGYEPTLSFEVFKFSGKDRKTHKRLKVGQVIKEGVTNRIAMRWVRNG